MKLPNYQRAIIDDRKFIEYCLNPNHHYGKHKAVVFQSALGINLSNFKILKTAVRRATAIEEAVFMGKFPHGDYYRVDFDMNRIGKTVAVRSNWVVKDGENFARLTSVFVL